jgi:hypothetical protein
MGEPESFFICLNWLYKLFGIEADARKQLATLAVKPKFELTMEEGGRASI